MLTPRAPLTLCNSRFSDGRVSSLRIVNGAITALHCAPERGDIVVDLAGDLILPGLINAHDHLQLNGLPVQRPVKPYAHVRDWIADVDLRRRSDLHFKAQIAQPREARLLIGAIKNLLSGVTTVAHHDPLYAPLCSVEFPVKVLQRYGWSHSLDVDGDNAVRLSFQNTPAAWPWMIHAAEGTNREAGLEFTRLEALGCLGSNTRLIHGVALTATEQRRLRDAGGALVWCPSSNLRLFGKTASVEHLSDWGNVALGSDSRLSGSRDLLQELQVARIASGLGEESLERMVTGDCARLLGISDRGALRPGLRADLLILPAGAQLSYSQRADVRLVLIDGRARYGDMDCAERLEPDICWQRIRVDGHAKALHPGIAAALRSAAAQDVGLEFADEQGRAA